MDVLLPETRTSTSGKGAIGLVLVARPIKFPQIKRVPFCYRPMKATTQMYMNGVSEVFYLNL
jgi:hypothetical protein